MRRAVWRFKSHCFHHSDLSWKDTSVVGIATLNNGTATLSTSALASGMNVLTANYEGDTSHARASSAVLNQMMTSTPSCTAANPGVHP